MTCTPSKLVAKGSGGYGRASWGASCYKPGSPWGAAWNSNATEIVMSPLSWIYIAGISPHMQEMWQLEYRSSSKVKERAILNDKRVHRVPSTHFLTNISQRPVLARAKGQGSHDAIYSMSLMSSGNCWQTHYNLHAWTGWGFMSFWLPW